MAEVTHESAPLNDPAAVEALLAPVPLKDYERSSLHQIVRHWVDATKTAYWVQATSGVLHRISIRGLHWPEIRDLEQAFKARHARGNDPVPLLQELVREQLAFRPERTRRETFFGHVRDIYNLFARDDLNGVSAEDLALLTQVHARLPQRQPPGFWGYPKVGFRQTYCEHCGRVRENKPRARRESLPKFDAELGQDGFRHWLKTRTKKGDHQTGATALFDDYRHFWRREYDGARNDKTAMRLTLLTQPKFGRALRTLDWCKRVKRNKGYVYVGIGLKR